MQVQYSEVVRQTATVGGIKISIPRDEIANSEVYDGDGRMPEKYITGEGAEFVIGADGKIVNWPTGATLDAIFKCADGGSYWMLDERMMPFGRALINEYVPACLNFDGESYGDYVTLKVDGEGRVSGFARSFTPANIAKMLTNVEEN